jgi:hypothetical protein
MTPELWSEVGILIAVLGGAWALSRRVDTGIPPRDWRERMAEKQRFKLWRRMHRRPDSPWFTIWHWTL